MLGDNSCDGPTGLELTSSPPSPSEVCVGHSPAKDKQKKTEKTEKDEDEDEEDPRLPDIALRKTGIGMDI